MPFASPREQAGALEELAARCDDAVEALLCGLPVVGDRRTQAAVDAYLDAVMDALRMLAVAGREASHGVLRHAPSTEPQCERSDPAWRARQP
ncbi:hypothetical protein [Nostocoides sp.]|uniref:hypothetical protein n=1 Tax=Nostocoides sp. TaxID=1917966 RepID=UPI002B600015|nr:hypothetical protein [Tetrasphaera sp.]